jgi:predicted O-methyltransferase YrrM
VPNFSDRRDALNSLTGGLRPEEVEYLYGRAQQVAAGVIVEIGSFRGKSAATMALGVMDGPRPETRIFCVEPHEHFRGVFGGIFGPQDRGPFYETMVRFGCSHLVSLVGIKSEVAAAGWREPIGLLFIDGDHTYPGVKKDAELWLPKLLVGGLVVFDDATHARCGVPQVVKEVEETGAYESVQATGTMAAFRRIR